MSGEIDGQVGKAEDSHEGNETALCHKLPAMVVCRVVAENRVHEFHDVVNVVYQRDGLFLRVRRHHQWQGSAFRLACLLYNKKEAV